MSPSRPKRRCTANGWCPNPALPGGACEEHKKEREARRGNFRDRGYGKQWDKRRRQFLLEHPYCEVPECNLPAVVADHLDGRRNLLAQGVTNPDLDEYLVAMCRAHHSHSTAKFEGALGNAVDYEAKRRWLGRS